MVMDVGLVKGGAELSVWVPLGFGWRQLLVVLGVKRALSCKKTDRERQSLMFTLKKHYDITSSVTSCNTHLFV